MVLILRIRLVDMEYCAFILLSLLPAAWVVAGCLVLVLSLVMGVLFVLKSREVITLKKQCEDLRETMRMMRYEEANLARMLHTASKPKEQQEQQPVAFEVSASGVEEDIEMMPAVDEEQVVSVEEEKSLDAELVAEDLTEVQMVSVMENVEEVVVPEETILEDEVDEMLPSADTAEVELFAEDAAEEIEVAQPTAPVHKHPINERRPAIPTDLFAAWFAENDEGQEELPAESTEIVEVPTKSAVVEKLVEEMSVAEELLNNESVSVVVEEPTPMAVIMGEAASEKPTIDTPIIETSIAQGSAVVPTAEDLQGEGGAQYTELSKEDERFCRKLERIVNTRLRNPNLNIDIIAAQFGIGRTNFYRKVRELTGMSPNDYLRKCRMERAAELLRASETAISEVCAQVGIPDAQYFSRVFKSYFGTTPSFYRENNNK